MMIGSNRRVTAGLILAIAAGFIFDLRAEELSFTVGLDTRCRYGLVTCWPEIREPLEGVDGVKSVGERADPSTLTGQIVMEDGRLLDLGALKRRLRESLGEACWLRGVEANLNGELIKQNGQFALRVTGTTAVLPLAALREKVQADPATKQRLEPTEAERAAYQRLTDAWPGKPARVRIVGPLVEGGDAQPVVLQVREFAWERDGHDAR